MMRFLKERKFHYKKNTRLLPKFKIFLFWEVLNLFSCPIFLRVTPYETPMVKITYQGYAPHKCLDGNVSKRYTAQYCHFFMGVVALRKGLP